jgi:hypothetical protein
MAAHALPAESWVWGQATCRPHLGLRALSCVCGWIGLTRSSSSSPAFLACVAIVVVHEYQMVLRIVWYRSPFWYAFFAVGL